MAKTGIYSAEMPYGISASVSTNTAGVAGAVATSNPATSFQGVRLHVPRRSSLIKKIFSEHHFPWAKKGTTDLAGLQKYFKKTVYPTVGKLAGIGTTRQFLAGIAIFGASAALSSIGNQLWKTIRFRSIDRPTSLRYGPGYISWGKTSGMPANHLSTDGLSLALSNMRHTSAI